MSFVGRYFLWCPLLGVSLLEVPLYFLPAPRSPYVYSHTVRTYCVFTCNHLQLTLHDHGVLLLRSQECSVLGQLVILERQLILECLQLILTAKTHTYVHMNTPAIVSSARQDINTEHIAQKLHMYVRMYISCCNEVSTMCYYNIHKHAYTYVLTHTYSDYEGKYVRTYAYNNTTYIYIYYTYTYVCTYVKYVRTYVYIHKKCTYVTYCTHTVHTYL